LFLPMHYIRLSSCAPLLQLPKGKKKKNQDVAGEKKMKKENKWYEMNNISRPSL
jgi:hypothetical protein